MMGRSIAYYKDYRGEWWIDDERLKRVQSLDVFEPALKKKMIKKGAKRAEVVTHIPGVGVFSSTYYLKNGRLIKNGRVVA